METSSAAKHLLFPLQRLSYSEGFAPSSLETSLVPQTSKQSFAPDGNHAPHDSGAAFEGDEHGMHADAPEADDREITETGGIDPEVAEAFIENKRIGDRIKFLRQRKQMGLVELGRHTGLSASFLSQLETGRVVPTLRNLARIAMVFSKDMSYFFEPERPEFFRVLRAEERQRLPQSGVEDPGYFFESLGHVPLDGGISPYVAEFLPGSERRQPRAHSHAGSEFLYVLNGCLRLTHDAHVDDLERGDAVFFHANVTHSYERVGEEDCEALILTLQEHPRGHHSGSRIPTRNAKPASTNGSKRRR